MLEDKKWRMKNRMAGFNGRQSKSSGGFTQFSALPQTLRLLKTPFYTVASSGLKKDVCSNGSQNSIKEEMRDLSLTISSSLPPKKTGKISLFGGRPFNPTLNRKYVLDDSDDDSDEDSNESNVSKNGEVRLLADASTEPKPTKPSSSQENGISSTSTKISLFSKPFGSRVEREEFKNRCQVCDRTDFQSEFWFTNHVEIHEGKRPFVCPYCQLGCASEFELLEHASAAHHSEY